MLQAIFFPLLLTLDVVPPQDPQAEIRQVAADWVVACNKGDAKAIGAMFAANAVLIEADGARFAGRAAIDASMAKAFGGPLKGGKCTVTVTAVTIVKPDVATADGTEIVEVPGQPVVHEVWMATLVKQGGKWLVLSNIGSVPAK